MNPSNTERRLILRRQHSHLRATVDVARRAAGNALGGTANSGELQLAVAALERELLAHLAEEERLLEPILETLDAWGPVRLGLLRAEHAHQRAVLAILADAAASGATTALVANRTLSVCDDLMVDMEFEERELLTDKLLRDDLVLLDASDC